MDAIVKRPGLLRAVAIAFVVGCVPVAGLLVSSRFARTDPADTEAQVRAVLLRQQAAWNAGDLERFMADYWVSDDLTFFSDNTVTRGHADLQARYRKRYLSDGKEMGTLTFSDLDITPMGADAAVARGRWKVVRSKESLDGLFTLTLIRFPGGWKITHDHTSVREKK